MRFWNSNDLEGKEAVWDPIYFFLLCNRMWLKQMFALTCYYYTFSLTLKCLCWDIHPEKWGHRVVPWRAWCHIRNTRQWVAARPLRRPRRCHWSLVSRSEPSPKPPCARMRGGRPSVCRALIGCCDPCGLAYWGREEGRWLAEGGGTTSGLYL